MKKLRLNVEQLTVESFETRAADGERGTVIGAESLETEAETCLRSCLGSCKWNSCNVPWQCPAP